MLQELVLPTVDIKTELKKGVATKKLSDEEIQFIKYADFFKERLEKKADYTNPNYRALEVINDDGFAVSNYLHLGNFKVCNPDLIEFLLENPVQLSKFNLVHAVMPFDDIASLISSFAKIPEVTNADVRVILGAYDYDEDAHKFNKRVLDRFIDDLDFCDYYSMDNDGTSLKLVCSTYQKNMKMRR